MSSRKDGEGARAARGAAWGSARVEVGARETLLGPYTGLKRALVATRGSCIPLWGNNRRGWRSRSGRLNLVRNG